MQTSERRPQPDMVELSCRVVTAYVAANPVPPNHLPGLIADVHMALIGRPPSAPAGQTVPQPTAAQIRASLGPGGLMSFETGKRYTSLRRHLNKLGLSPTAYRQKWGLPQDYPMVCAAYSSRRADIARRMGLGRPAVLPKARSATASRKRPATAGAPAQSS